MKVYYNSLGASGAALLATKLPDSVSTGVCVFSHSMTSTEKNFIAKNIINRPVNTSQSVAYSVSSAAGPVTIDVSSININVSHILLTLDNSIFNSSGTASAGPGSGTLSGTTWSAISADGTGVANTELGVAPGWLKSAELILGNDRTGSVPGSCLTTNKLELFNLTSISANRNIYILKLAGSAFSTAGIPFSRLNNKKLVITYADGFTLSPYGTGGTTVAVSNINVTCCGTQIQSTVGGTISFSA